MKPAIHLVVTVVLFSGACAAEQQQSKPLVPRTRQPLSLTLPRLGGGSISLASLRRRPVLLYLFTTWSLRAQAEAKEVVRIDDVYRRRGLKVIGIAVDRRARDPIAGARSLIETYVNFVGFRFPIALATPDDLELVGAIGMTRRVPRTVLIDRNGLLVQDHHRGQTNFPQLLRAIESLLLRGDPVAVRPRSE